MWQYLITDWWQNANINCGLEAFFILFFLNITSKLVISQMQFLGRHHFCTLLRGLKSEAWISADWRFDNWTQFYNYR